MCYMLNTALQAQIPYMRVYTYLKYTSRWAYNTMQDVITPNWYDVPYVG